MKWSEKVSNEQVIERIGEKRILVNNIPAIKPILRKNCLLHGAGRDDGTETSNNKKNTDP